MDNEQDVPFANETGLFVLRMSEVITDAWAFNDERKKEIALEALYQWALHGPVRPRTPHWPGLA